MLLALILRGVAFEFRLRGRTPGQGVLDRRLRRRLAGRGLRPGPDPRRLHPGRDADADGAFAGGPFDWLTPYTLLVACGLVAGYALLGAGWLIWKTEDELHGDARRWAWIAAGAAVGLFLAAVSLATLFVHPRVAARWGFDGRRASTCDRLAAAACRSRCWAWSACA